MQFVSDRIPRRKRKPKGTALDNFEPFLKLKAMVMNGKMKPYQQVGILLDQSDVEQLQMKFPWRTVAEHLRRLIADTGLESDYTVVKYETDTPGVWFVRVTYEPANIKAGSARGKEKAG